MTEQLYWGVLALSTGIILVLLNVLRHYLSIRGNITARSMLHKERMTALSKDMQPPGADSFPTVPVKESRLRAASLSKLITVPGLVLLFGGIGMGLSFWRSDKLQEWANLAWIPIFTGAGLLLYLFVAKTYFKEKHGS